VAWLLRAVLYIRVAKISGIRSAGNSANGCISSRIGCVKERIEATVGLRSTVAGLANLFLCQGPITDSRPEFIDLNDAFNTATGRFQLLYPGCDEVRDELLEAVTAARNLSDPSGKAAVTEKLDEALERLLVFARQRLDDPLT
jgi:hypothetical protein